jgi:hypothetical protein
VIFFKMKPVGALRLPVAKTASAHAAYASLLWRMLLPGTSPRLALKAFATTAASAIPRSIATGLLPQVATRFQLRSAKALQK